jgi:MFS family permease
LAAPIIVIACRLVQGLALGGEVGLSTTYLIEIAPQAGAACMAAGSLPARA